MMPDLGPLVQLMRLGVFGLFVLAGLIASLIASIWIDGIWVWAVAVPFILVGLWVTLWGMR